MNGGRDHILVGDGQQVSPRWKARALLRDPSHGCTGQRALGLLGELGFLYQLTLSMVILKREGERK